MRNTFSLVQSLGAYFVGSTTATPTSIPQTHKNHLRGFEVQESVGVGLSAERWAEDAIATIYGKNGKMFPTLSMSYRFHKNFSIDASAGTGRLTTANTRNELQLLPVTVGGSILFGNSDREPFVSVGTADSYSFLESSLPYYTSEFSNDDLWYQTGCGCKSWCQNRHINRSQLTQHPRQPKVPYRWMWRLQWGIRHTKHLDWEQDSISMRFVLRLALTCGIDDDIFHLVIPLSNASAQDVTPMSQIRFAVEEDTMVQTLPNDQR